MARPWSSRFERGGVDSDYREEEKSGKGEEEDGEVGKNGEVDEGRARGECNEPPPLLLVLGLHLHQSSFKD